MSDPRIPRPARPPGDLAQPGPVRPGPGPGPGPVGPPVPGSPFGPGDTSTLPDPAAVQARTAKTRRRLEKRQVELTGMRHGPGPDNTPPTVVETTRADGLWPFLLLRTIPGDYGARPSSPQRIANINSGKDRSPDIIVVPAGPATEPRIIDRSGIDALWDRRVSSMEFAAAYDVWVHVWNLGQTPATGVRVRVRLMPTGTFVGGTLVDLGDRLSATAHRVVKVATLSAGSDGHVEPFLVATVECFSDVATGDLSPGMDRHTAHRLISVFIPS